MSFIEFLKKEYNLTWDQYVALGDSTEQKDIDKIEEILDGYEEYEEEDEP